MDGGKWETEEGHSRVIRAKIVGIRVISRQIIARAGTGESFSSNRAGMHTILNALRWKLSEDCAHFVKPPEELLNT